MNLFAARSLALALLVVGLGLHAAGCGGGNPSPSVASLGTTSTPTSTGSDGTQGGGILGSSPPAGSGGTMSMAGGSVQQMTRFAGCMRKNGEPSFPDPNAQGQISVNIDPGSAQFQKAQQACRKAVARTAATPSPAQQSEGAACQHALAFSACMRSHGEPNFPDPQFGPGGSVTQKIRHRLWPRSSLAAVPDRAEGVPERPAGQVGCRRHTDPRRRLEEWLAPGWLTPAAVFHRSVSPALEAF